MGSKDNLEQLTENEADTIIYGIPIVKWRRVLSSNRLPEYLLSNDTSVRQIENLCGDSSYNILFSAKKKAREISLDIEAEHSFEESYSDDRDGIWISTPSSSTYRAAIKSGKVILYASTEEHAKKVFYDLENKHERLIAEREKREEENQLEKEKKKDKIEKSRAKNIISQLRKY